MEKRWLVIVCDAPKCRAMVQIPIRDGFWQYQPWQEAINAGCDVSKDDGHDRCPRHSWFWQVFNPIETKEWWMG